jgi:hypothetical protein
MIICNIIMVGLRAGLCGCLGVFVWGMDVFDYICCGGNYSTHKKKIECSCGKGTTIIKRKSPYCGVHPIEHHACYLQPPNFYS